MTSPYYFYFVVVPRRTSNLTEVRFGEVVVLKQISVLHHKNSWIFSKYLFDLRFSCAYAPGYIQTFISFALLDLSNIKSSKKSTFVSCSVLTDSATICVCLSIAFFLSSFDHGTFEEVSTVVYALYVVFLSLKRKQKGWFTIMFMLTLLIELCEVLYEGSFQV
jgi:hypothetical protein